MSLALSPRQKTYSVGTEIVASADSNPSVDSYKWVDTKANTTIATTSHLALTSSMLGKQTMRVEACNTLPGPPPVDRCNQADFTFTVTEGISSIPFSFLSMYLVC